MRILLAIDGSPCSDAAVDEVCRRPWPTGSDVRIVTARTDVEMLQLRAAAHQLRSYDEILKQPDWKTVKFLEEAASKLEQLSPNLGVTLSLLEGPPKYAIIREAERWGADLIVVGSHGTGAIRHFFLGSVSLAVALHAQCSVEIVRRSPKVETEKPVVC